MAGNIRNQRTTFQRKAARRARAAKRFTIDKARCEHGDGTYQKNKLKEAQALGITKPLYI